LVPISSCSGSKRVETNNFTAYNNSDLSYFGYIITQSTAKIYLTTQFGTTNYTNSDIEAIASVGTRKPLGTSGLYLISFTKADIGSPKVITITSAERLTVSMVQQGNGFSMSNFISRFPEKGEQPTYSQTDCTTATLTAKVNAGPYQWYLNGVLINGATNNTYVATSSGNYSVTTQLECGISAPSLPVNILLCNIDRSITKTVNVVYPELNSNVVFTLKAENLGDGNAVGVSVTDLLPSGFTYISSVAPQGTSYDPGSGIWTIGDLASNASMSLKITAKVVKTGQNVNTATITGSQPDQVIINEYTPGQGISPHIDCEPCFGNTIISLSLGSACIMEFTHRKHGQKVEILLRPRSLVVLSGESRSLWTHGIPVRKQDVFGGCKFIRSTRVSLTFRKVIK
ncbi:MAG: DUF11 domain-containing protein, partial [Pedobacter sp.]